MCFNKVDTPILFDNLGRPLDLANTDSTLWNDKCDHHDIDEITDLNSKDNNLIVLQLNIRSLLGKQNDLNILLNKLCYKKSPKNCTTK